ncbi:hypothetical protein SAMN05444487_101325 [Marininema mesophilum]|uniref:Uncharacterized protein n=1 Tax=Marininema mesophilum TaxID=1048340 RepID=A0A1H2QXB0_9BACL|nr:hypothetical protein [Marininema mesophilum]SDW11807.1 hypothetical protein SAMN05444487_101325 [Marininema mesophilum]
MKIIVREKGVVVGVVSWMIAVMISMWSPETAVAADQSATIKQESQKTIPKDKQPGTYSLKDSSEVIRTQDWLTVDPTTGQVEGVWLSSLPQSGIPKGEWSFTYPDYKLRPGWNKEEQPLLRAPSHDGAAFLRMQKPGSRRVLIDWKGASGGTGKSEITVVLPGISMAVDPHEKSDRKTIRAHMAGKDVKGSWTIAVANMNDKILQRQQGKSSFTLSLPSGKYLVRAIFRGEVDGTPIAMHETKKLRIENGESEIKKINKDYENEYFTSKQALESIDKMKKSGYLADPEHEYASKGAVMVWSAVCGVIGFIALFIWQRVRKRSSKAL